MDVRLDQQKNKMTIKPADSKRSLRLFFIFILISYLFLFSSFALYHIYVTNELDDSHGCSIGEWIHLGHQAAAALFITSSFLSSCIRPQHAVGFVIAPLFYNSHLKRGPPLPNFTSICSSF